MPKATLTLVAIAAVFSGCATPQEERSSGSPRLGYHSERTAAAQKDCLYDKLSNMRDTFGVTEAAPAVVEHTGIYTFTWPALGASFANWVLDVKPSLNGGSDVAFYNPFGIPLLWRRAVQACAV